mmetsp:Transcript_36520/g.104598  ORF Transcript_36520/g.104598 Transcript_36520/m.104598 type:complete len:141 (+) Transcript_36520:927-1349(+)
MGPHRIYHTIAHTHSHTHTQGAGERGKTSCAFVVSTHQPTAPTYIFLHLSRSCRCHCVPIYIYADRHTHSHSSVSLLFVAVYNVYTQPPHKNRDERASEQARHVCCVTPHRTLFFRLHLFLSLISHARHLSVCLSVYVDR